jgi:uncharacterized protein (TIGR03382 family)
MIKTLLASGLTIGLLGCAVDSPDLGTTAGMSFEEFRAKAAREPGTGYYVVDWDRIIRSDDELLEFWGSLQQGALAIYNTGTDIKWNDTQKLQLTYCVGAGFAANKQKVVDAMAAASNLGWEKMANVNFTYVPGEDANCTAANNNVVMDVNQVNSGGQYLARSFFPNSARADRNVLIDPSSFDPAQTGNIPLANILGHELGHTLGFRHEHIRPEAGGQCPEDNQFRGVTVYDSASVMHYPQCGGSAQTLAFTELDRQGVVSVYGPPVTNVAPMTQLTAPLDGATVPPNFAVEASVVDTDLAKAELFIDGTSFASLTAAPFTFQVTNEALGAHTLKIVGTDSAGLTGETTINVTVTQNGGGGSGSGSGGGGGGGGDNGDINGGCAAGGSGVGIGFALGLLGLAIRRRR